MKNARLAPLVFLLGGMAFLPAPAKTYTAIKGESTISYLLVHKLHEVVGVNKNFRCDVLLSPDTLQSKVYVKAAIADFNSGNSSRDANAVEVLEAYKYPFVEFASDSVRHGTDPRGWHIFGKLTFHGVKKPLDFWVDPKTEGNKIHVRGAFRISLTEYKVERPRLLMIPIDDSLGLTLHVVAPAP